MNAESRRHSALPPDADVSIEGLAARIGEALGYYFIPGEHHDRPYLEGSAALEMLTGRCVAAERSMEGLVEQLEAIERRVRLEMDRAIAEHGVGIATEPLARVLNVISNPAREPS